MDFKSKIACSFHFPGHYYNIIIINSCEDGFGDLSDNSVSVYINNRALTFFEDLHTAKDHTYKQTIKEHKEAMLKKERESRTS